MDQTLVDFIKALRNSDVRISPAETIDAMHTVELVGYQSRPLLRDSLALVLPKTEDEKRYYYECFDRFFAATTSVEDAQKSYDEQQQEKAEQQQSENEDNNEDEAQADGDAEASGEATGEGSGSGESEGKSPGGDPNGEGDLFEAEQREGLSALSQTLLQRDTDALGMAIRAGAAASNLNEIRVFTQRGLFTRRIIDAMGGAEVEQDIRDLRAQESDAGDNTARDLDQMRGVMREMVRDEVERQFNLYADVDGKQLREEILRRAKLGAISPHSYKSMQRLIHKMAKQLISQHSRRRRVTRRGQLDIPKTLRANWSNDGILFNTRWKSTKVDRPNVLAICDVSGSVATVARFLLMFLYSLNEVLPKVRSFAFSSYLGEVTELFDQKPVEEAIEQTLLEYGGPTDYGRSFADFQDLAMADINNKTTVIILGDGRNNYGNPREDILKEIYDRSKRVLWLNPEPESFWRVGDAEMRKYSAYCHEVQVCNSLKHLERIINQVLKTGT